jgi:hypothetical protein
MNMLVPLNSYDALEDVIKMVLLVMSFLVWTMLGLFLSNRDN